MGNKNASEITSKNLGEDSLVEARILCL